MKKKCSGCGSILQDVDSLEEGFTRNLEKDICERCFRIKNYGDYKIVDKTNLDFIPILKKIDESKDLVVFVVDIFMMAKDFSAITKYLSNDILFVFTKRDILPLSIPDSKLLEYADNLNINYLDKVIISSNKNYGMDELIEKIRKYQNSKNVYIVGYTNAGKSTMINKLIYNYSDLNSNVTTSILPSTTLDTIEIKLDDTLTLMDTPGILENGNIINFIEPNEIKKVIPKKEIKAITYQAKGKNYIQIEKYAVIEVEDNNLTLFFSNDLKIERFYKEKNNSLKENIIRVKEKEDIVISGLGFIKVGLPGIIKIKTLDNVDIYTRKSLI